MTAVDSEKRDAQVTAAMAADGARTEERQFDDYFGFDDTNTITLPDGVSYVETKTLNEGQRRKYQNALNRDVRIQRQSGDAIMRMAPGDEKKALLTEAIVGWNLKRNGAPVPFNKKNLEEFLDKANPKIVDLIEKEVRKANAWLQADMTVEDIQREIDQLEELKVQKEKEAEGK